VYCAQSPLYVAVSRLALRDEYTDVHAVARASWDGPPVDKYKFRCNFANNGSAADMPYVEENQLFVIPHARHTDGMHMASPCDTVPFGLFVSQLPVAQKAEVEGAKAKRASKATDELIDAYPWLADLDDREGFSEHIPSESCGSASSGHGDRAREDVVLDEDAVEQAMRELDEVRAGLAAHEPRESESDFKTSVLGGQWLLAERGLACDAIQGSARGALTNDFCASRSPSDSTWRHTGTRLAASWPVPGATKCSSTSTPSWVAALRRTCRSRRMSTTRTPSRLSLSGSARRQTRRPVPWRGASPKFGRCSARHEPGVFPLGLENGAREKFRRATN